MTNSSRNVNRFYSVCFYLEMIFQRFFSSFQCCWTTNFFEPEMFFVTRGLQRTMQHVFLSFQGIKSQAWIAKNVQSMTGSNRQVMNV